MPHTAVTQLLLQNFRNYNQLTLELEPGNIILTGANGAGKTNILEALSFLTPGRGLRSAKLDIIDRHTSDNAPSMPWAVHATLTCNDETRTIGTGRIPAEGNGRDTRRIRIDDETTTSQSALAELLGVVWLTPQMDGLFLDSASARRKFLDRLVYGFFPEQARNVNAYDKVLRERNRLLADQCRDPHWHDALEARLAELGVAIAAARNDTVATLNRALEEHVSAFPGGILHMDGETEAALLTRTALETEDFMRERLQNARQTDLHSGRTSIGIHRSDLNVLHKAKNMPAALCSTGEQKALMLSIVLADVRARTRWHGGGTLLLLDEVVAHLDPLRRGALFEEIAALEVQAWLTGTDQSLFDGMPASAQHLTAQDGTIRRGETTESIRQ